MDQSASTPPEHRNSLGYVIADRGAAGSAAQAMIVWGRRAEGTRVSILEAKRGACEHLKCECGAELVARKGEVNAYHFAHASGGARSCRQAQLAALSAFSCEVLTAAKGLLLPVLRGQQLRVPLIEAKPVMFDGCGGVVIASAGGEGRREMAVLLAVKRGQALPDRKAFLSQRRSAIVIDLAPFRNGFDDEIAEAIVHIAGRRWIYNDRFPRAVEEQERFEQRVRAVAAQARQGSGRGRSGRAPLVSEVEWHSLSPAELRRRLFGNKYER